MDINTNILIHDNDCEQQVLASIVFADGLQRVIDLVDADCFFDYKNRKMYEASLALSKEGMSITLPSLLSQCKKMSADVEVQDIARMTNQTIPPDIENYAKRLKELQARRTLCSIGYELMQAGQNEAYDLDEARMGAKDGLESILSGRTDNITSICDVTPTLYEIMAKNAKSNGEITGTPTGFPELDERGGLQKSDLIIIAGCSSAGKTSFASTIAVNGMKGGAKIAFYSMEMTKEQLTARIVAMESGVSSSVIMHYKNINPMQLVDIDKGIARANSMQLYFDDSSTSNIEKILSSIRTMVLKHGIDGAIIDYLQILNVNQGSSNKEQAMADVARRLKNIAKELDIWIIALSQLNRDKVSPIPNLNRVRDSGQIVEAADVVILVYRPDEGQGFPEPYEGIDPTGKALIDVAKGRNIGIFKFICNFDAPTTKFIPLIQQPKTNKTTIDLTPF